MVVLLLSTTKKEESDDEEKIIHLVVAAMMIPNPHNKAATIPGVGMRNILPVGENEQRRPKRW